MRNTRALITAVILACGCLKPRPPNGALLCNQHGKQCPDGYYCIAGSCWQDGQSPAPQGSACNVDSECVTGRCVDKFCCDKPCEGQCEACDLETPGTCSIVKKGAPHGSRLPCTGVGDLCGGICDGASATACSYPSADTVCGAMCDGKCNGSGVCNSGAGGSCPNGLGCSAGTCKTACSTDSDCQTNFHCMAPDCVRNPESDCLDGVDNNGDGRADCEDPTCQSQVFCAPAAPTGAELGVVASACPPNYTISEVQHQQLGTSSCTGCGCDAFVDCVYSGHLYGNTTCSGAPATDIPAADGSITSACVTFPLQTYQSMYVEATGHPSCTAKGTPTPNPPYWRVTTNFCAASRSSATCDSSHICLARPSMGSVCVRVPQPNASCPSGYGNAQNYYSDYVPPVCGMCGCTVDSYKCNGDGGYLSLYKSNNCVSSDWYDNWHPTISVCQSQYCYTDSLGNMKCDVLGQVQLGALAAVAGDGATCSAGSSVITPGTPSGGSTICCH